MRACALPSNVLLTVLTLASLAGCSSIYDSAHSVPEPYRAAALRVVAVGIGMSREQVYAILGPPRTSSFGVKERWSVYQDDPLGAVEIIFLHDHVVRLTFTRLKAPTFGIVKDLSDEDAPPLPLGPSL